MSSLSICMERHYRNDWRVSTFSHVYSMITIALRIILSICFIQEIQAIQEMTNITVVFLHYIARVNSSVTVETLKCQFYDSFFYITKLTKVLSFLLEQKRWNTLMYLHGVWLPIIGTMQLSTSDIISDRTCMPKLPYHQFSLHLPSLLTSTCIWH